MNAFRWRSALFTGRVMHQRLAPFKHGFHYSLYMHRLELDELPVLDRSLRLFGVNRRRPSSFYGEDHVGGRPEGTRAAVEALVRAHGIEAPLWRIDLLTNCRVFGYVFNPVSFYFCYAAGAELVAIVAEVHNTFGERHCYVLPAAAGEDAVPGSSGAAAGARVWRDKKVFHVSPFMTLDGTYRFQFSVGDDHVDARVDLYREGAPVFVSRLTLDRQPLTDRGLAALLLRFPFMTARIIAAIHWQALRLWWKGGRYHSKPQYDPGAARGTGA